MAATAAHATFCFCPPDNSTSCLRTRSSMLNSRATSAMRCSIRAGSTPRFSHPKASSPVTSRVKNWDLGFWKTDPTV